jgi:hypothetical protein
VRCLREALSPVYDTVYYSSGIWEKAADFDEASSPLHLIKSLKIEHPSVLLHSLAAASLQSATHSHSPNPQRA